MKSDQSGFYVALRGIVRALKWCNNCGNVTLRVGDTASQY